jgi:L-iditol 2-dehydrogenase
MSELDNIPKEFSVGVMTGVGNVEVRTVEMPPLRAGEALVRLEACAICTWEQRSYSGAQSNRFPFVGGHEMVGTVVAFGDGYKGPLKPGARVSCGSASCGSCEYCYTGRDNLCPAHYSGAVKYGEAWGPGGFAEYKVHPADALYNIGDAPAEVAALTEPLSCALHAARLSGAQLGFTTVVLGAGVMGLMNVIAQKAFGSRVIVSEIDPGRLDMARRLGAHHLVDARDQDPVEAVMALTDGHGADIVVTAFGSGKANEQGMAMLAKRGTLVLFASAHPETPLEIGPNKLHNEEKRVIGVVSSEKLDFYRAANLIRHGMVDLSPLVQNTYPLSEVGAALDEAVQAGTYRIVVKP